MVTKRNFILAELVFSLQKKNLSDSEVKSVATEFKKGSFHKCRVLDFDYLDLVAGVTLRE